MRLSMSAGPHHGGPAPAPTPLASVWALLMPLCLQVCSWHSHGDGAAGPCRADPVHTSARWPRAGWSRSSCLMSHAPTCLQPPTACPALPCPAPHRGLPGFSGVVFLPTPASRCARSHKGRTCRLSDRSSLTWHCGWWRRGRRTVVSGTGKCRRWGGGSLQPGFLSCTAATSQIKVPPGGAAAAPRTLGRAEARVALAHGLQDGSLPALGLAPLPAPCRPAQPPQPTISPRASDIPRDMPTACTVSTWHHGAGGMRHVCVFPSQDVRLFTQLHLRVLDATTNQTKYWRELSVDAWCPASSPEMPCSTALDPSRQRPGDPSIHPAVSNHAPTARAAAASPGAGQGLVQANTWVILRDLCPGMRYHIQVRSKPDGTSMDGVWGPWSQAVAAETPHSSGDIGLRCSTPDLLHVRCEWSWDPTEPRSSHQLFYRLSPSGASTREDTWQLCEESVGAQGTHACTFQPRAGSAISVLVNITQPHASLTLSFFKEPFWLHQAVLTDAPQLVQATVSQGRLSLQWLPPLEALAEQLDYQVRYAVENSHDWKVLQVPRAAKKEVLDLRPGARYHAQVRAQPSGPWYQGSWSAWSKPVAVDAMADAGWIIPSVTVVPLLFTGVLLGLRCTFPSLYSNVKQKLWPPVPDLHRALGSFLHESSKHGQASAFYKQPPEEAVLPCLLEVLPGPRREAGASPPAQTAGRLPSTDIANQSYLLMSGWELRGPP
ncbi:thrombopoietin receptor isoform X2 [Strix aluco]|uniref:thrombopoietin receptor isoform X2 n=1 Tax=Strix aluco TaxID=111821 RepID=UPI003DA5C6E6